MSLRNKAIVFAIALGTVPVIVSGFMSYYLTSKKITEDAINQQKIHVGNVANELDRFTISRYKDIQKLSQLSILNNPKVQTIPSAQEKVAILDNYRDTEGYNSIAVAETSGKVLLQSKGGDTPKNFSKVDYFKEVMRTNRTVILPPRKSVVTGKYAIFFAAPILDTVTGKTIGMVRSLTYVNNLNQLLDKQAQQLAKINKNFESYKDFVINEKGKIVLSQQETYVDKDIKSVFPKAAAQLQAADKVISVVDTNQLDGKEYIVSYAPAGKLENLSGLNWGAMVVQPTADAFAARKGLLSIFTIGTGVTALLASGLAVLLANRATNLIKQIASAITSSSTEIATTVEQQERTVSQQASSVSQTTTTMDELDASSRQSAEQAEASAAGARQALALAENGTQAVQQTMQGMTTLKDKVGAISEQILRLSEQTMQIGGISGLVGDLANQTNMLALNAAVEAARAGEHGKGFSVVAGEIRKLADESKKSAQKITSLVADIQGSINTTVMVTDEGTKTVDRGIEIAHDTAETFTHVADSVNNVFLNSQQISLNVKQQAIAVRQVVEAMNAINLGARESAAGISQVKISTQQLQSAAVNLKQMV